jgi:hypothetical protein
METAMERVIGSVDLVTTLKRYMMVTEMERMLEEETVLQEMEDCPVGTKGKCRDDILLFSENEFSMISIMIKMDHCKRLIAISEMWGGVGSVGDLGTDSFPRLPVLSVPRPFRRMEWRLHHFSEIQHIVQPE